MANPGKFGDAKPRAYRSRSAAADHAPMAAGPPKGATVRCEHCDRKPIEVEMKIVDGRSITLRACCTPQWLTNGKPMPLEDVIALIPRRERKAA